MAADGSTKLSAATPRVAAGVLFRDDAGGILMLRPTYKTFWDLPGGYVEPGESPHAAATRELAEELGQNLDVGQLLSVDWAPQSTEGDKLLFIFDGGTLAPEMFDKIRFADGEIDEARFVPIDGLDGLTIPRLATRIRSTIEAADSHRPAYLEHGVPVTIAA